MHICVGTRLTNTVPDSQGLLLEGSRVISNAKSLAWHHDDWDMGYSTYSKDRTLNNTTQQSYTRGNPILQLYPTVVSHHTLAKPEPWVALMVVVRFAIFLFELLSTQQAGWLLLVVTFPACCPDLLPVITTLIFLSLPDMVSDDGSKRDRFNSAS